MATDGGGIMGSAARRRREIDELIPRFKRKKGVSQKAADSLTPKQRAAVARAERDRALLAKERKERSKASRS